jgi:hypothetical protein
MGEKRGVQKGGFDESNPYKKRLILGPGPILSFIKLIWGIFISVRVWT